MSGLKVWIFRDDPFVLECVDAAELKAAIEAGEYNGTWLPCKNGGSVLGGAIVAIAPPPPSSTAKSLRMMEQRRKAKEEDERRLREDLPPLDDRPSKDIFS